MPNVDRRTFLEVAGATIVASAVAGCTGGDGSNDDGGSDEGSDGGNGGGDVPEEIDDYLSSANEYDGTVADRTGESEVTVDVGAGDGLAYDPPAVRIDAGTTVVWEWTGDGGGHDVTSEDGELESELYSDAGQTYEYTFDSSGVHTYYCSPHEVSGMKGGVVVE